MLIRNNTPPPAFALPDSGGQIRSLDDVRAGQVLVLLFFRGAFCATSRRDLLAWSDIHERVGWLGGDIIAVSVDPPEVLASLKETLELRFEMLSDADFEVSRRYGIYESDEVEAGPQPHSEPATFVLNEAGNVIYSQIQSGPKGAANPNEILLMLVYMRQHGGRYWEVE